MGIINRIINMGSDPLVTIEQIDTLVNGYLSFLRSEQLLSPEVNLCGDIFALEAARQQALLDKMKHG